MMLRWCLVVVLVLTASACSGHLMVRHEAEELAGAVEQLNNPDFLKRRNRATDAVRKRVHKFAPWLHDDFSASYEEAPAIHVIRAVLGERLSVFRLSEDAGNPKVKASEHARTVGEHLDAIASQTNWNYDVVDGIVYWDDVPTKVFKITFPQGTWQSQVGRGSSAESESAFNDDNQYAFLEHKINLWEELEASLQSVLGDYKFTLLPSVNSITVTAPPDYLMRVQHIIDRFNKSASQRVLVELEIYLVDLSDSEQQTLDWSFVRNLSRGGTANVLQDGSRLLESLNPFTVSLNDLVDGKHRGHFIFSALAEQGATTVVSRPKIICLNNQVSELRLTRVTPYTSEISYSAEQNIASSRLTPNVSTDEVVTGTTIYLLPTINGQRVNLSLSVNYTQINRFLNHTFGSEDSGINVQLPEYDDTQFTLPVALNSGETMVLAGNPRIASDAQTSGNRLPLLGRKRTDNKRRTETVMLLTVHVLDSA